MSQLHIYVGSNDVKNAFIIEEKRNKNKNRKQIRFLKWNIEFDTITVLNNWIKDEITTLRLKYCYFHNSGKYFICPVANYASKNIYNQHWSYIINTHFNQDDNYFIVPQMTSFCSTPIFDYKNNTIVTFPDYYEQYNYGKLNLVVSSCGKSRILNDNKISNKWIDYRDRKIKIIKNKLYIEEELKYDFDTI